MARGKRLRASEKEAKKGKKKKRVKRGRKEKEIKAEIEEEKSELSAALCERAPLLEQKHSSTSPFHLYHVEPPAAGRSMPIFKRVSEDSVETAPAAPSSEGCIRKKGEPLSLFETSTASTNILASQSERMAQDIPHDTVPNKNNAMDPDHHLKNHQPSPQRPNFGMSASSESMSEYSTDSVHSTLGDELNKLNQMFEPDNPFRTAAVLRDAVVGLGTLTRKLHQLFEADPIVADCPADVEMLVRRAGELYGSLQHFAVNKGIPVTSDIPKLRGKCQSNPELLFEDDAPWLDCRKASDVPQGYATSDAGCCQAQRDGLFDEDSGDLGPWEEMDSYNQVN